MCSNNAIHTRDEIAVSIKEKEERGEKKVSTGFFLVAILDSVLFLFFLHKQQVVCTYRMKNNLIKSIEERANDDEQKNIV